MTELAQRAITRDGRDVGFAWTLVTRPGWRYRANDGGAFGEAESYEACCDALMGAEAEREAAREGAG